ncbi:MAG: pyruvate/ketoisovalerate ferredoxin oxidoreductase subunit gamma [Candidatus Bathyarchaeota archaeon B23]|nr:MAG: pyruvate/ketoisovalerate ferredoxin oxidoreductase subunit gamma [Candidatus Bathyarchaeota archaeon B23]
MIEIRLHGRGGQGVVASGEMIALAAVYEGKYCRAFPFYGSARRGSPVVAFAQIGEMEEATRCYVYTPDVVLVLDPEIPRAVDVTLGLKSDGVIVWNTELSAEEALKELKAEVKIGVVDATTIALESFGRPIPNTALLGAFARTTGMLKLESIEKAIRRRFSGEVAEKNVVAARRGFEEVSIYEP